MTHKEHECRPNSASRVVPHCFAEKLTPLIRFQYCATDWPGKT